MILGAKVLLASAASSAEISVPIDHDAGEVVSLGMIGNKAAMI
jgi:hypothetical protein